MARLFAMVALLLVVPAGVVGASAAPAPARVIVLGPEAAGDSVVYRLRVVSAGSPVMVLLPHDTRLATLEIDGLVRQRVGREVPEGSPPLGHAVFTFLLANLQPADLISIRILGSAVAPRVVTDGDFVSFAHSLGFVSGAYYAILLTLCLFQLVAFCMLRDQAIAWYLGFTFSLFCLELSRDGIFPSGTNAALGLVFRTLFTVCLVAFTASFLRLRSQAPRLFVAAIVANVVPALVLAAVVLATHRGPPVIALIGADTAGMAALFAIAVLRRRNGFLPAMYLALGLLGLPAINFVGIVMILSATAVPFMDRWGLEIGAAFDTLAFSFAVLLRARSSVRERARIQRELKRATFSASHDELTGLLNRRGLEARVEELTSVSSTVLFVDLDGFKAINDLGGHAAGDRALKTVARILREAARETDAVARVGGDEFIVVLAGCVDPADVAVVRTRISSAISFVRALGADDPTRFGVSIGTAQTIPGQPFDIAIADADADAYRVKAEHYTSARELKRRLTGRRRA